MKYAFALPLAMAFLLALPAAAADHPITWTLNSPHCTQEYLDGKQLRTIEHQGLRVSVAIFRTAKDAIAAEIYVANDGAAAVDVLPDQMFILATPRKAGKPAFIGMLSVGQLVAAVYRNARITAALDQLAANLSTVTTTTSATTAGSVNLAGSGGVATGTFNANTQVRSTGPDWEARRLATYRAMQAYAMAEDRISAIEADALKANTVHPGGAVGGIVWSGQHKYFGRSDVDTVLNIRIGDETFQFPERAR